ncbi:hypothetical protein F442_14404 [Phytophthora nicotianae P10297]|uniref:Uncharacterized protein n=2 Tax=Phytophthora nicotianae TaxID=4792 RepID=W2YT49_PHYNI|nr:hypothetical protein F444_14579 [Phytophthora nicotianae P1976]ETP37818.1 hypothetical protein F442_14404 [Phytophthora nicotianae P10297]
MTWMDPDAVTFFYVAVLHISCVLTMIKYATTPDRVAPDPAEHVYNLLAPPDYALSVMFPILLLFSISRFGPIALLFDYQDLTPASILIILVGPVIFAVLVFGLIPFLLFCKLRLYLAPITLILVWAGALYCYASLESTAERMPERYRSRHATEVIQNTWGKLSVRLTLIWLSGAVIFSIIDMVQIFYGEYFGFESYVKLMGLLLAFAVAAYVQCRDPVVAWVTTWFVMVLANRTNVYEGETKETFEKLQAAASAAAYIFEIVLILDTIEGLNEFLGKFIYRPDPDSASESDDNLNTVYGTV